MRFLVFSLLLLCLAFADNETEIKRSLTLITSTSCPGDLLLMNATASDGMPAFDVELRLVLYVPYQGLRALQHTDENGLASVQLTKNGTYRVYINTEKYNTPQYITFQYPKLCPPPPPKSYEIEAEVDCKNNYTIIRASVNGTPLSNLTVQSEKWSSVTSDSGEVSFPLELGYLYVSASRSGFSTKQFFVYVTCEPEPECESDSMCTESQYCSGGSCLSLGGDCGFAANHTWFNYECCSDSGCGFGMECLNNSCVEKPKPQIPNITNQTNQSGNVTAPQTPEDAGACPFPAFALLAMLLLACRPGGAAN